MSRTLLLLVAGWLGAAGGTATVAALSAVVAWRLARNAAQGAERALMVSPRTAPAELVYGLGPWPLRELALLYQEAGTGKPATVPMESPIPNHWLDSVRFDPATLHPAARRLPLDRVRLTTVLGPAARRPLPLDMPVLLSGMGWGVSLAGTIRQVLAEACALTGIALNSGEGPFDPGERAIARRWVFQWGREGWRRQARAAALADMIELQVGQASEGGGLVKRPRSHVSGRIRSRLTSQGPIVAPAGLGLPLAGWVRRARSANPDVPLAVKIPASQHVEQDLAELARLGVDVVTLDGAGAGTSGSPAVLADHLAIPTPLATVRARRYLDRHGLSGRMSLVVSGHVHGAADIFKLLALGADAVAVGSAALLALAAGQSARPLPEHAPTALVFALDPAVRRADLDRDEARDRLVAYLTAIRSDLALLATTLGYADIARVGPSCLVTDDAAVARALDIAWAARVAAPTRRSHAPPDHRVRRGLRAFHRTAAALYSAYRKANRLFTHLADLATQARRMRLHPAAGAPALRARVRVRARTPARTKAHLLPAGAAVASGPGRKSANKG